MGEKRHYTRAFRRQALEKAYLRGSREVKSIASELNINPRTLFTWMRRDKKRSEKKLISGSKRPTDRTRAEKLELLMGSHGLDEAGLNGYCREKGIFVHHLRRWREEFETGTAPKDDTALREMEASKKALERELKRKEKALAEAAALLVLKKKYEALWEDEED
jgi:transposase-like protein